MVFRHSVTLKLLLARFFTRVVSINAAYLSTLHKKPSSPMRGLAPDTKGVIPIALWPEGLKPGSTAPPVLQQSTESFGLTIADPFAATCSPGDQSNSFINVTDPMLLPFELNQLTATHSDKVVLVIPGGGPTYISWEKEGTDVAVWLNSLGIAAYVLKYRLPGSQFSLQDAQRAMSLLHHYAKERGINTRHVGTIGFGSGGLLSMRLVTANSREYTPIDHADDADYHPDFQMLIYSPALRSDSQVNGDAPATFIATAGDDQCVQQSDAVLTESFLKKFGGKVDMHIYPDGRHGYGTCAMYVEPAERPSVCEWPVHAAEFLQKLYPPQLPSVPRLVPPSIPDLPTLKSGPQALEHPQTASGSLGSSQTQAGIPEPESGSGHSQPMQPTVRPPALAPGSSQPLQPASGSLVPASASPEPLQPALGPPTLAAGSPQQFQPSLRTSSPGYGSSQPGPPLLGPSSFGYPTPQPPPPVLEPSSVRYPSSPPMTPTLGPPSQGYPSPPQMPPPLGPPSQGYPSPPQLPLTLGPPSQGYPSPPQMPPVLGPSSLGYGNSQPLPPILGPSPYVYSNPQQIQPVVVPSGLGYPPNAYPSGLGYPPNAYPVIVPVRVPSESTHAVRKETESGESAALEQLARRKRKRQKNRSLGEFLNNIGQYYGNLAMSIYVGKQLHDRLSQKSVEPT